MTADHPPAFQPAASIELQSGADSKIIGVSLYSSRAEITRLYKFAVRTGQNQVSISGLPNILEAEFPQVEGRGAATIHDVTVSTTKGEHVPTTSPELAALSDKREEIANTLERCQNISIRSLFNTSMCPSWKRCWKTTIPPEENCRPYVEQLRVIDDDVALERARITVPHENDKLRGRVAIGVFAETAGDVEIALVYVVPSATWTTFYDIRVDMNTKEDPITLIYKPVAIVQNTGEALFSNDCHSSPSSRKTWDDVPLILETSTPTLGLVIPQLSTWNLDFNRYDEYDHDDARGTASLASKRKPMARGARDLPQLVGRMRGGPDEPMLFRGASVTSRGNVSAIFRVPGLVSIPSDGEAHNFTIVQVGLEAVMSWVSVPKVDTKAHITAKITNAVYVDGGFISRPHVPAVSPKESFDKRSHSGFYTKSANYVFSQRITVFNTKGVTVDQIPTSQNAQIEVKLVSPVLMVPSDAGAGMGMSSIKAAPRTPGAPQVLSIAQGVVVQWDGVDEPDCAVETLGLDRKLNWICSVPSQGKINLALDWEVTVSPASAQVVWL
ncbi:hypothetical protein DFH07DRAFT_797936 [Mycena maculata]|uniref:DUF4139 domain-containing protein n=1 Tax=Mycena maculata TaxID=230809 RepID=A0AAD7K474_9AGAR|nr:hypothetical protein DFH07DRAFT_797936 [Mycena maculata]